MSRPWLLSGAVAAASPVVATAAVAGVVVYGVGRAASNRLGEGQNVVQAVGGGTADALGISAAVAVATDRDIATGEKLNLTREQRIDALGTVVGIAATAGLAKPAFRVGGAGARVAGEVTGEIGARVTRVKSAVTVEAADGGVAAEAVEVVRSVEPRSTGGRPYYDSSVGRYRDPASGRFVKASEALEAAEATGSVPRSIGTDRVGALLEGNRGVNVTARADALRYSKIVAGGQPGAGTPLTDLQAVESVIGKISEGNRMTISPAQASALEDALGLPTGRLGQGGVISIVDDVALRAPRSPVAGNQFFLGGGRGLPGGGPEVNVAPIGTAGGGGIRQVVLDVR